MAASWREDSACCSRHWALRRAILSANGSPPCEGRSVVRGCLRSGGCGDFHDGGGAARFRDRLAVFAQARHVNADGLSDLIQQLFPAAGRGHAPGEIGHPGGVVLRCPLNDNGVLHSCLLLLHPGLPHDTRPGSGRQVVTGLAGDGDRARFVRVSVLAMTSSGSNQPPPVAPQ